MIVRMMGAGLFRSGPTILATMATNELLRPEDVDG